MKRQIRKSVWETNSSSTHSLTVAAFAEGDILDTLYPNNNNQIIVEPMDFGWDWEDYSDPQTKLSYCAIYARDWVGDDTDKYLAILTSVIQKQVGIDIEVQYPLEKSKSGYYRDGYIDHQSVEDRDLDYLFQEPELLRQFIFNPKSTLSTGNDNDSRYYDDEYDTE